MGGEQEQWWCGKGSDGSTHPSDIIMEENKLR